MAEYEQFLKLSDLPLASACSCLGFRVVAIERSATSKRGVFVFEKSADIEKVVQDYWARALRVIPQDYFAAIRDLKSRLYSEAGYDH